MASLVVTPMLSLFEEPFLLLLLLGVDAVVSPTVRSATKLKARCARLDGDIGNCSFGGGSAFVEAVAAGASLLVEGDDFDEGRFGKRARHKEPCEPMPSASSLLFAVAAALLGVVAPFFTNFGTPWKDAWRAQSYSNDLCAKVNLPGP